MLTLKWNLICSMKSSACVRKAAKPPWPQLSIRFQGRLDAPLGQTSDGRIDVKSWVARNGIDPNKVIDIGPVPNAIMPPILREMDCALSPIQQRNLEKLFEVDVVDRTLVVEEEDRRKAALERLAALKWPLPPDYKFDRDEANER